MKRMLMFLFVSIFLLSLVSATPYTLQDYYETADTSGTGISGCEWIGQSFTAGATYNMTQVAFRALGSETGNITIWSMSGDTPQSIIGVNSSVTTLATGWFNITLESPVEVISGTKYGIVTKIIDVTADETSPSYAGGVELYTTDCGASWPNLAGRDALFQTYSGDGVLSSSITVALNSPTNASYNISSNIKFNASAVGTTMASINNATLYIWNSTNGLFNKSANTLTGINSTTFTVPFSLVDVYKWNVEFCGLNATGTVCNIATTNNTLTWGYNLNTISYTSEVFETTDTPFTLNITLASGLSLTSSRLWYNVTSYSPTVTSVGGDYIILKTLTVPSVSSASNYTFKYELVINGNSYNTSSYTQQIDNLDMDNCTTNTQRILNFTFRDEDSRAVLVNPSQNITTDLSVKLSGSFDGTIYNYYHNQSGNNPLGICISSALATGTNYRLDVELSTSATDRVKEYFYLDNMTINSTASPLNYNIYDLLSTQSQEFLITFKDSNFLAVSGALIELHRQYLDIGQFLPVEISKTDSDGRTIGHFVLNDQVYNIYVRKNNKLIATFENIRVYCQTTTSDCRLNLNQPGSTTSVQSFKNYLDVSYGQTYNSTTRVYSVTYSTTDGSSKIMNLTAYKVDNYNNITLCSTQQTSYLGTLSCTLPATTNGTAIVKVTANGNLLFTDYVTIDPLKDKGLSPVRYLIAFILIVTLPIIAMSSGVMTLITFIVALVLSSMMFLIDGGGILGASSVIIWFIISAIILIWKASRSEQYG